MINIDNKLACPICNVDMSLLKENVSLYSRFLHLRHIFHRKEVRRGDYVYYQCNNCSHTLLEIPEEVNLKYQSDYRINMPMKDDIINGELSSQYYANREWILNGRIAKIGRFIREGASIFDIGCGGGYVLDYYKKREHIVAGIEIDDLCINACKKLGINCLEGDFLKADIKEKYDVVMAWHCLEHVSDINAFLRKMVDITNKDGLIIIEIPIDRALVSEPYDGHVHYFTRESLKKLTDKFNIKCTYSDEGVQKPAWLFIGEVQ